MLSQDLLNASLQIPFSVPPYMSLLARAVATLEGIALSGNPDYQMVAEVHSALQHAFCATSPEHATQMRSLQLPGATLQCSHGRCKSAAALSGPQMQLWPGADLRQRCRDAGLSVRSQEGAQEFQQRVQNAAARHRV